MQGKGRGVVLVLVVVSRLSQAAFYQPIDRSCPGSVSMSIAVATPDTADPASAPAPFLFSPEVGKQCQLAVWQANLVAKAKQKKNVRQPPKGS